MNQAGADRFAPGLGRGSKAQRPTSHLSPLGSPGEGLLAAAWWHGRRKPGPEAWPQPGVRPGSAGFAGCRPLRRHHWRAKRVHRERPGKGGRRGAGQRGLWDASRRKPRTPQSPPWGHEPPGSRESWRPHSQAPPGHPARPEPEGAAGTWDTGQTHPAGRPAHASFLLDGAFFHDGPDGSSRGSCIFAFLKFR